MQAEIARSITVRWPEDAGADTILRQWAWLAVSCPPPPPPPPPPGDAMDDQMGDSSSALVSWEPRNASEELAPAPVRVAPAEQKRKLITRVNPVHSGPAKFASNAMRFVVVIGKDGRVLRESMISGNSRLARSAVKALHQWVYEPTLVNGAPVEVVTETRVEFKPGK